MPPLMMPPPVPRTAALVGRNVVAGEGAFDRVAQPLETGMGGLSLEAVTSSSPSLHLPVEARRGGRAAEEEDGEDVGVGGTSSDDDGGDTTAEADWHGALAAMEGGAELKPRAARKVAPGGKWSKAEDAALRAIVEEHGPKKGTIARSLP